MGETVLSAEDVLEGEKRADGIAKGGHHVDVHGSGTYQKRQSVRDGRSYDIPYGCLVPRRLENVLVAAIGDGVRRFGEVRSLLGETATPRATTLGLKAILSADWAERTLIDDYPPTAGYRLSADGRRIFRRVDDLLQTSAIAIG